MRLLGISTLILGFALAACSTMSAHAGDGHWVMRHLDTPRGERDPDLTETGQARARALDCWFGDRRPRAIYVSDFRRTRQSVAPLAARLAIDPIVYDPGDTSALVARVRSGPMPALIVGHSNTVPDIVEALGGERPPEMSHEDFGDIWWVGSEGATVRDTIACR